MLRVYAYLPVGHLSPYIYVTITVLWCWLIGTGDGDRLGDTRRKELVESYVALGVPPTRVHVVDHPCVSHNQCSIPHWVV